MSTLRTYTLVKHQGDIYAAQSLRDALDLAQPEPCNGRTFSATIDAMDVGAARLMLGERFSGWHAVGTMTLRAAGWGD